MKRRYFVKAIMFLLLTAMVLLSVTAYGDNTVPEDEDAISESEVTASAPETAEPSPAETASPEIEPEIPGEGDNEEDDPALDQTSNPETEPVPEVTPVPEQPTVVPGIEELYPCPDELDVPVAAEDPEWDVRFKNATVYTGRFSSEFRYMRNQDDILKLTPDGLCELDVLVDNGALFFDFYSGIPGILDRNMELHIRHKGTYTVKENGVISAVFDRSEAYVAFSSSADEEYRLVRFEKEYLHRDNWPYYVKLFSGKAVDLGAYKDVKKVTLLASIGGTGNFSPMSFDLYDGSEVRVSGISYTYEEGRKTQECHMFYASKDGNPVFLRTYDRYFNKSGFKTTEYEFDEKRTPLTMLAFAPDGRCIAKTFYHGYYGAFAGHEYVSSFETVDFSSLAMYEEYEKEDGTKGVRSYNGDRRLVFEREINASGNVITVTWYYSVAGENHRYDYRYEYDARGDCVRFERRSTDTDLDWFFSGEERLYTYDARGHLVKEVRKGLIGGDVKEIFYDENGNVIKEEKSSHGSKVNQMEYIYNDNGSVAVSITYDAEGNISRRDVYTYWDNGLLQKQTTYDADDEIVLCWEYDETGNLKESLFAVIYMVNGDDMRVWVVTYYGTEEGGRNLVIEYDENWNTLKEYVS